MADQLEEIKNKINIVDLISEYLPLKKAGQNFKALCPFHAEKIPSFIVSPERQIWHCFGGCGAGGDIFGFLMRMENMDFGEALRTLAKKAGVKLRSYRPSETERQKELLYEINHLASEFYHYLLFNHPVGKGALDYILGRGIIKDSLQLFKLGFAPDAWDSLQKFLVAKKGYKAESLEAAGLVIKSSKFKAFDPSSGRGFQSSKFYDRFRNRLIFPLKDHRGNVCGFAGRTINYQQSTINNQPKYINTPETVIYHKSDLLYGLSETKEAIKKADQAILVEGELDAISSYQTGVRNVVAIKGSALTPNQVRLLSRFTPNIVFALDKDLAGDQAARRGIEVADEAEMSIQVVKLQGGKDPDEVAQKNPQLWRQLVKEATPIYDYFLDSAFSRFDSRTAEGKRKIGQELVPILAKISNEIVRAHYVKRLAERLGVSEEAVVSQINKRVESVRRPVTYTPVGEAGKVEKEGQAIFNSEGILAPFGAGRAEKSRREILEEHLLALCFQAGNWKQLRKRTLASLIKTPRFGRLLTVLAKYLKRYKTLNSQRLAKMLPAELVESFNRFYFLDLVNLTKDEEEFKRELNRSVWQLEKLDIKERLETLSGEIGSLERQKEVSKEDRKKLALLHQQFREFSGQLAKL